MRVRGTGRALALLLSAAMFVTGCPQQVERTVAGRPAVEREDSPYLKVHLKDGRLLVLTEWTVDEAARIVRGTGTEYDVARRQKGTRPGAMEIRLEDVALFETNEIGTSSAFLALAIVTGVSAALTAFCLTNWKSCFGSCPTFYASDGSEMVLQAEGFSDSVAPSLEATDIDALSRSHPTERNFKLEMTNEALETHVVRSVRILAVPKGAGGTVLRTPKDTFLRATSLRSPSACASETGSCLPRVVAADGDEWFRPANDEDLGRREEVQLEFNVPAPRPGAEPRRHALVLTARQSLLSTFVLYQGLAFMGTEASTWLAALETERASSLKDARSMLDALGGIEVEVRGDDGTWRTVGEARETGPLAVDTHAVPLPEGTDARHVRLRLTQGHWRIDRIALAEVADAAAPVPLTPTRIRGEVSRGFAPSRKPATAFPLVTLPGDRYALEFELPEHPERYDLFVESRGYYLEWMRKEWMREENPARALEMVMTPEAALRSLAPAYKKLEASMERAFWGSRYAAP